MPNEKENTGHVKKRKTFDAIGLALLLPGLGHIYCGKFKAGMLWMGTAMILILSTIFALISLPGNGLKLVLWLIALELLIYGVGVWDVWRISKRLKGQDYRLRDYNHWVVYLMLTIVALFSTSVGLAFVVRERVVEVFVVPTESMSPTIIPGDRLVALKDVFLERDPEHGELVITRRPHDRRHFFVSRVIALAGDTVEWKETGEVLVNGVSLKHSPSEGGPVFYEENGKRTYTIGLGSPNKKLDAKILAGKLTVPSRQCFLMGDKRWNSYDSRSYGTVAYTSLIGKPFRKISPGFGKLE